MRVDTVAIYQLGAHSVILEGDVVPSYVRLVRTWHAGAPFVATGAFLRTIDPKVLEQHAHDRALAWCHDNHVRHLKHLGVAVERAHDFEHDLHTVVVQFIAAGIPPAERRAPRGWRAKLRALLARTRRA